MCEIFMLSMNIFTSYESCVKAHFESPVFTVLLALSYFTYIKIYLAPSQFVCSFKATVLEIVGLYCNILFLDNQR